MVRERGMEREWGNGGWTGRDGEERQGGKGGMKRRDKLPSHRRALWQVLGREIWLTPAIYSLNPEFCCP